MAAGQDQRALDGRPPARGLMTHHRHHCRHHRHRDQFRHHIGGSGTAMKFNADGVGLCDGRVRSVPVAPERLRCVPWR
jgi:hypothetical protein